MLIKALYGAMAGIPAVVFAVLVVKPRGLVRESPGIRLMFAGGCVGLVALGAIALFPYRDVSRSTRLLTVAILLAAILASSVMMQTGLRMRNRQLRRDDLASAQADEDRSGNPGEQAAGGAADPQP